MSRRDAVLFSHFEFRAGLAACGLRPRPDGASTGSIQLVPSFLRCCTQLRVSSSPKWGTQGMTGVSLPSR